MIRSNGHKQFIIPTDLLDDIASRFLLDAPDSELNNAISLCFLTELAFWFYLDEYVEEDDSLNALKFDSFALQLLTHVNIKPPNGITIEKMLQDFRDFKHRVPTYGALMLNFEMTHVLLVQGFWHRASWGFPKGKINVDEEPHECAIREVLEETGYDISTMLNQSTFLENIIGEMKVRLYIIQGVPMTTDFVPRTKGEIKEFRWFAINELPSHKHDRSFPKSSTNMFYMVMPFVKPLKQWLSTLSRRRNSISSERNGNSRESRKRHQSLNSQHRTVNKSPCDYQKNKNLSQDYSNFMNVSTTDTSSPKKKSKNKGKAKKNDTHEEQPQQQKFTFKSRSKSKSNNSSTTKKLSENIPANNDTKMNFRSYSWQNFRLNKKALNEALDRAWSGVIL